MPGRISDAEFEKDTARILDDVIETGIPIEVERRGRRLVISPVELHRKLERLEEHAGFLIGDPDDIVHIDWSKEWRPSL